MDNLEIQLGGYTLIALDDDSYWFEAPTGEGTGIDKKYVLNIVEAYFAGTLDDYFNNVM